LGKKSAVTSFAIDSARLALPDVYDIASSHSQTIQLGDSFARVRRNLAGLVLLSKSALCHVQCESSGSVFPSLARVAKIIIIIKVLIKMFENRIQKPDPGRLGQWANVLARRRCFQICESIERDSQPSQRRVWRSASEWLWKHEACALRLQEQRNYRYRVHIQRAMSKQLLALLEIFSQSTGLSRDAW